MTGIAPAKPSVSKHFTSSILLRMRTDKPRQEGMDRWKGLHSGIHRCDPGNYWRDFSCAAAFEARSVEEVG
ncbi:MAG: hypothetical protein QM711_03775 [Micropruina sp.]|uniref:hypothetical protein n=1 Tax=Micropruina sp. TaxID=2737536 RepID=UPI0039E390F8